MRDCVAKQPRKISAVMQHPNFMCRFEHWTKMPVFSDEIRLDICNYIHSDAIAASGLFWRVIEFNPGLYCVMTKHLFHEPPLWSMHDWIFPSIMKRSKVAIRVSLLSKWRVTACHKHEECRVKLKIRKKARNCERIQEMLRSFKFYIQFIRGTLSESGPRFFVKLFEMFFKLQEKKWFSVKKLNGHY